MADNFDFIIVGGGSAGCLLANRLSANPEHRVLLLEAGPPDDAAMVKAPLGTFALYHSTKFNWKFWSREGQGLNERQIFCPQGKTLGGSSAINAMIYARGHREDYDHWQALGNRGWGYDEMLKHFKACEYNEDLDNGYHGSLGELNVQNAVIPHPHSERLVLAGLQAGYPYNPDFNGESQEGVGLYQLTIKDGQRCSAAHAFLQPVKHRQNLTWMTDARVSRIHFQGKCATGVSYHSRGEEKQVFAAKEVIICAGTFNSAKLLMLSGIGPEEELAKHNIPLLHALPGVGRNLQEHVDIVIATKSKIPDTLTISFGGLVKMVPEFFRYLTRRKGAFCKAVTESGGFIRSNPDKVRPNIQLQGTNAMFNKHGFDAGILKHHGYSLHVTLLQPKSRGEVRLRSDNYLDNPDIRLNLLQHDEDIKDLTDGLRLGREILAQDAYRQHCRQEVYPGADIQSDEEIAEMLRHKACHVYHPVGTCKMGHDDMAVVDDCLRVHGIENLRVIDASVMPVIVSGNTNAPVMAIASKGAELILQTYRQPLAS